MEGQMLGCTTNLNMSVERGPVIVDESSSNVRADPSQSD